MITKRTNPESLNVAENLEAAIAKAAKAKPGAAKAASKARVAVAKGKVSKAKGKAASKGKAKPGKATARRKGNDTTPLFANTDKFVSVNRNKLPADRAKCIKVGATVGAARVAMRKAGFAHTRSFLRSAFKRGDIKLKAAKN